MNVGIVNLRLWPNFVRTTDPISGARRLTRATVLLTLLCAGPAALAQIGDLRLPISLDADSTDYDGRSSLLLFEGLRLSQGNIGVQADKGFASKLDFEDSVWKFEG